MSDHRLQFNGLPPGTSWSGEVRVVNGVRVVRDWWTPAPLEVVELRPGDIVEHREQGDTLEILDDAEGDTP